MVKEEQTSTKTLQTEKAMEGCNKESSLSLPHMLKFYFTCMLKSCFTLSLRWLEQNSAYMETVEECGHAGEKTIKKHIKVPPLLLHEALCV